MHHRGEGSASIIQLLRSMLIALGVVYGDIGTSPLYAMSEILHQLTHGGRTVSEEDIIGVVSLILWTIIPIINVKYIKLVMKADHNGEGGTFAFLSKVREILKRDGGRRSIWYGALGVLLLLGGCLLFGEGAITPPISVLSAVEGIGVVRPDLAKYTVIITMAFLTGLFCVQHKGTAKIGVVFGVVTKVWFLAIAGIGLYQIIQTPKILNALFPWHAVGFLWRHGVSGSIVMLGSAVLVMTGGEALWADMGHFGRKPIALAWKFVVFPALLLSYLGQGAYLLSGQAVVNGNVFYSAVPEALRVPMIPLATAATMIASQALISGAFSLTSQGINLGLIPRLKIVHTASDQAGQIYVPFVNWTLWMVCCWLVWNFKSSANLAAAYGMAVTTVMTITSITMAFISIKEWGWSKAKAALVWGGFGIIDLAYWVANAAKLLQGAYIPLIMGFILFALFSNWQWGRGEIRKYYETLNRISVGDWISNHWGRQEKGQFTAVVLTSYEIDRDSQLPALLQILNDRYNLNPEKLIFFHVNALTQPYVEDNKRLQITKLSGGHISVVYRHGFMENPDISSAIDKLCANDTRWVIWFGREVLHPKQNSNWLRIAWFKLFRLILKLSTPAQNYFGLAESAKVESVGVQVCI